jgi:HSP20 family molecular chaperone IbpA
MGRILAAGASLAQGGLTPAADGRTGMVWPRAPARPSRRHLEVMTVMNMWDEFDRLWADMDRLARRAGGARGGVVRPALRIRETQDAYHVSADVPGVPLENLDVEAHGQVLRFTARRADGPEVSATRYEQTLSLPQDIDAAAIDARLLNGVLDLTIPKPEQAKPRRVTVTAGAQEPPAIEAGEGSVREGEAAGAAT